jgi:hypothetical protein
MSDNYRLYAEKMAERRAARASESAPLHAQLEELYQAIRWCERIWEIEERIERSR